MQDTTGWAKEAQVLFERLEENQRRWVGGLLAMLLGRGGVRRVSEATGLDRKTIRRGREELREQLRDCPEGRVRRPGAGRPRVEKKRRTSSPV